MSMFKIKSGEFEGVELPQEYAAGCGWSGGPAASQDSFYLYWDVTWDSFLGHKLGIVFWDISWD